MQSHNLNEYDLIAKILLVGNWGVGKTSICRRYAEGTFQLNHQMTIGVDFKLKTQLINGKRIKFQIWDYAGSERFRSIVTSYYRGCHGVLMVFDLTMKGWKDDIIHRLREVKENTTQNPNLFVVMFGNKSDLEKERLVTRREAEEFAREQGIVYMEGSAKNDVNINEAFEMLGSEIERKFVPPANQRPRQVERQRWRNEREELPEEREEKYSCWGVAAPAVLLTITVFLALVTNS